MREWRADGGLRWVCALIGALCLMAQASAEVPDPPGRVGRVSYVEGRIEAWTADSQDWAPINVNMPVTSGIGLWTATDGRAEVRIGSTSVRLDADSQLNFDRVDDAVIALEVRRGVARVRLRSLPDDDQLVISAGGVRVEAQRAGDYALEYDPGSRRAWVSVFAGRARVSGIAERLTVLAGQRVELDAVALRLVASEEAGRSSFDEWAERRDREQDRLASSRYVSPEMTGIEALDGHGRWEEDSRYGPLWYPVAVAPGWAPYRYGHWAWVAPWGWTWIDDAPWGFAPFHYGRWIMIGGRWGWAPGSYVARPVYAPALVGFYGGAPGFSISVRLGPVVGWFPLAPFEVYRPAYTYSETYIQRINITHVTRMPPMPGGPNGDYPRRPIDYRYGAQRDAATFVSRDDFFRQRPIQHGQGRVNTDVIRHLPIGGAPPPPPGVTPRPPRGPGGGDMPVPDPRPSGGPGPQSMPPRIPGDPQRGDLPRYPIGDPRRAPQGWGGERAAPPAPVDRPAPAAPPTRSAPMPTIPIERDVRPQSAPPQRQPGMPNIGPQQNQPGVVPGMPRQGGEASRSDPAVMPRGSEGGPPRRWPPAPGSEQPAAPQPHGNPPRAMPMPGVSGVSGAEAQHAAPRPRVPEGRPVEPRADRQAMPAVSPQAPRAPEGGGNRGHESREHGRPEQDRPRRPGQQSE
ncbi:FecR family protein [Niveibacterium sp. COAC-50]|uniref:FecR family protein n=1 Tax=Niveibacterium sp. COAC-50 TaxID=2729384 RepID=UPI0015567246|nr:FecR family protein [Niveibacterium sp. COAC-50]